MKLLLKLNLLFIIVVCSYSSAMAIGSDAVNKHIHSYVYNENQVYTLMTRSGYQSYIEVAADETIRTLSVGDPSAFKISPTGNRIFIRSLQDGYHTNMTLVTNRRTYQFELSSVVENDDDLVYVMKFYYPQEYLSEEIDVIKEVIEKKEINPRANISSVSSSYNYNYSLAGAQHLSPIKVFDDGRATYFKFAKNAPSLPNFFTVLPDGTEKPIFVKKEGEYVILPSVLPRIALRYGGDVICVFNDKF